MIKVIIDKLMMINYVNAVLTSSRFLNHVNRVTKSVKNVKESYVVVTKLAIILVLKINLLP